MDTRLEALTNNDAMWAYHDDLLVALDEQCPIQYIELSTPLYLTENITEQMQISVTDLVIFLRSKAVTLKRDIEQLTAFRTSNTTKKSLALEVDDYQLRIKLADFLESTSPNLKNFKPLFEAADAIYELLSETYKINLPLISKQMKFPILSAHDHTWALALNIRKPGGTIYPSSQKQDAFFSTVTSKTLHVDGRSKRSQNPHQLSIIHPDKLQPLRCRNQFFQNSSTDRGTRCDSTNYQKYFTSIASLDLNDSFYESLEFALANLSEPCPWSMRDDLVLYLRQHASTYQDKIKIESHGMLPFETWLNDISTPNLRHIPSSEIHALAQMLKRDIVMIHEIGNTQCYISQSKTRSSEPIFILLQSNGVSYNALKLNDDIKNDEKVEILSAIYDETANEQARSKCCIS